MRWAVYIACVREMKNLYIILTETTDRKRSLRRPRQRWEHTIRTYLNEIGCVVLDWLSIWLR